ncbi:I78 family peptidase inhibitor [Paenalcaligenes niemegkensis]|uniref:I78 family peptidase inhibitor n=1 Tax=Paenalcaligenes niemegkensis TaxID=2895469 RepID=UPI001EE902E4|nr:I78 family peptidase inhibitor [Paenalcaligenes niemegkensis]MCQ9616477.1 I78 family peptidase inhibitor [Paenalcaligenes niemegkensis]
MQKETPVQPTEPPTSGYVCNADEMQHLVGFAEDDVVLESLPGPVRVLRPNSVATMDMRPDRINLHTDDDGVIIRVTCG